MSNILDQSQATANDGNAMQFDSDNYQYGQSFVPSSNQPISRIIVGMWKGGVGMTLPAGNIFVEIRADNAGSPGTLLGTSQTTPRTSVTSVYPTVQEVVFDFTVPVTVASGTTYWLVITGDGATDADNYIGPHNNHSNPYAGGLAKLGSQAGVWSVWSSGGRDLYFKEYYDDTPLTNIKKAIGQTYANIKKVAGVPIASVKKLAGLA